MTGVTFGNIAAAVSVLFGVIAGAVVAGRVFARLDGIAERVGRIESFIDRFTQK